MKVRKLINDLAFFVVAVFVVSVIAAAGMQFVGNTH